MQRAPRIPKRLLQRFHGRPRNAPRARQGRQRWEPKALRNRLSGLRAELDQVLADTDGRWVTFGFRRPAEGRIPEPVESVEVARTAEGVAMVKWPAATRATSYRVTCKIVGSDADAPPFVMRLVRDTACAITGLPSEAAIVITVTARNRSGESAPVLATEM